MAEYIEREALEVALNHRLNFLMAENGEYDHYTSGFDEAVTRVEDFPAVDVDKLSDGYHTFADLYEQRLILSAALAKNNPHAWKSKRHEDGSAPFGGGWFIMGFDTDEGCYTYHYELKDWDLFHCKELDKGKPWDGHTSKDVRRLLSIPAEDAAPVKHGGWIFVEQRFYMGGFINLLRCSLCKSQTDKDYNYCPNCGARMDGYITMPDTGDEDDE